LNKITVGILKAGSAPDRLSEAQGDYDAAFRSLLADDDLDFVTYDVEHGKMPDSIDAADAWLITGSRHGVYEDHSWLRPLEQFIRDVRAAGRPLVGICFGHQIVAQALGGQVERAAHGWIAGPQDYHDGDGTVIRLNAWHRDQVIRAPEGAESFLTGAGCPIAGLRFKEPILTLQAHPEFDQAYFRGLFDERGAALPESMRDHVERTATDSRLDRETTSVLIKSVLKRSSRASFT
jgi:GMP synthase-like glutamine amidotransferase